MKRPALLWTFWLGLLASANSAAWGATVAQIQLNCLSVRFQLAYGPQSEKITSLMLTSDLAGAELNGELAPLPPGGRNSHGSFFVLMRGDERADGFFLLDVPNLSDTNTNGVPDFFEVDLPVPDVTTTGSFEGASVDPNGKITATWHRDASSREGACRVTMDGFSSVGGSSPNLTFTNKFLIMEFTGALSYRNVAGETNVTASVNLTQKNTSLALTGTMVFSKLGSGRLSLRSGLWKNQKAQTVAYEGIDELQRNGSQSVGPLTLLDGDPSTEVVDYVSWVLRIVDPNDSNGNGLPDLSDEGGKRLPPTLSLSRSGNDLLLSISGEVGKPHQVETSAALGPASWSLVTSVTLTNDPQSVLLRVSTNRNRTAFWRVKAPQ